MARPKANVQEISDRLIEEAERLLAETRGRRLVLSEIADRVGISQSYVHRFFPTKAALVRALAQRWFDEVERESSAAAGADVPAAKRLEVWMLGLLRLKRDRYDEDPALFDAYLELAGEHPDLVAAHTGRLHEDLARIVAGMVPAGELPAAVALVEDATILFRTPHNISRCRAQATDERAKAVIRMLVGRLR
ncbi:MAG: TetR/AcrR family transcriptional regulator [Pikeienuella sp.]